MIIIYQLEFCYVQYLIEIQKLRLSVIHLLNEYAGNDIPISYQYSI